MRQSSHLEILGCGPAGSSAALAALQEGASVTLFEKSALRRHKVCGEFLSPGIEDALRKLAMWEKFKALRPSTIRRMAIQIGGRRISSSLPEPAFGLSRYYFDALLSSAALDAGASVIREAAAGADIVCAGRRTATAGGDRLFGFKAHFQGPLTDEVELYFTSGYYVGVNCIEDGLTNVCGLARESHLAATGFHPDELLNCGDALRQRINPLHRCMDWMFTGPVVFGNRLGNPGDRVYNAGDALSFVDPFTGTGLLSAVITGTSAGRHAARRSPISAHLAECRRALETPFHVSSILRKLAMTRAAETLVQFVPGSLLYRWTRPRLVA